MLVVRRLLGILFSVIAVVALVVLAVLASQRLSVRPRTDDAFLQADLVHMAPDVSGRIVILAVHDNELVHAGELLFEIDPEPYRLRVAQAAAEVRGLEGKLGVTSDQVASQTSKAQAANTGIGTAKAQLDLASSTLARLQPLLARGFVTAQQVDQARTARKSAQLSLEQARQQAEEARKGISSIKPAEQDLAAAQASLSLAERDLRLTAVRAPCDGRITGLDIAAGEFADAGKPLFTIIDTEHWWAVGNFRETDMSGLQPGQHALVYVLAAPGAALAGTVESLGWGVSPDEGAQFEGLPRVPRSLNWVRIAQRFPVRVRLDTPPANLMRIGASAAIVIER
ncbi:multidrug transporter subunit MdtN [Lichenicola sp.]|uniref:multidrug transporter subunit MdtN n=1 Tax=Lichenicola sp. TaxID=2804529 RepID=UPI003B00B4A2